MGWKDDLDKYDMLVAQDLDVLADKSTEAKDNDVGFVNSVCGAGILARENGNLEGFADYGLGFRFSRKNQSLLVFAPAIHLFTKSITKHETAMKQSYLKDEYSDIERLLKGIKITER